MAPQGADGVEQSEARSSGVIPNMISKVIAKGICNVTCNANVTCDTNVTCHAHTQRHHRHQLGGLLAYVICNVYLSFSKNLLVDSTASQNPCHEAAAVHGNGVRT